MTAKRFFDLFFTIPGILLLLPVLAAVAVIVKLDSPGPVIFRQERVGRFGRPFMLFKFRTMTAGSDVVGPKGTSSEDARITRAGRFLRRTKLDELPQLWNVVRADMSIVGPRPEVPEYVAMYDDEARRKILSVRPGITDNGSIMFRNENQLLANAEDPHQFYIDTILPQKVAIYKDYADHNTVGGDLLIILRSLKAIVFE